MVRKNWTWEETVIAFNVYCKIPFSHGVKTNPTIIKYANILGRTPSALAMKIGNIARLDPELKARGISGLKHGAKMEEKVWEEFYGDWDRLAFESEKLIAEFEHKDIENLIDINLSKLPKGEERERIVRERVNQQFFRHAVLSAYDTKCCITGLGIPELLEAAHILSWKEDEHNRTNPHNGLCLNSLHHKAFDMGFITITPDFLILISENLNEFDENEAIKKFFSTYRNKKIFAPKKFLPSQEYLDFHSNNIFRR